MLKKIEADMLILRSNIGPNVEASETPCFLVPSLNFIFAGHMLSVGLLRGGVRGLLYIEYP